MGLANLVPGISGGTMILAIGLYEQFIAEVADVTRLRLRRSSIQFLGVMAVGLFAAVVIFSGVAVLLVTEYRPVMYALFIGMTLGAHLSSGGGAPLTGHALRRAARHRGHGRIRIARGARPGDDPRPPPGGGRRRERHDPADQRVPCARAGMYDTVIGALSRHPESRRSRCPSSYWIGAGLGIALLSNLLKALLQRFSSPSHGVLLGLLLGSVLGLYPFQQPVHPELAVRDVRKAVVAVVVDGEPAAEVAATLDSVDEEELAALARGWEGRTKGDLKRAGLQLERFSPGAFEVVSAALLFLLGLVITRRLGRGGGEPRS